MIEIHDDLFVMVGAYRGQYPLDPSKPTVLGLSEEFRPSRPQYMLDERASTVRGAVARAGTVIIVTALGAGITFATKHYSAEII